MKFADAPPGIKFALGENVKQSNWDDRERARAIRRRAWASSRSSATRSRPRSDYQRDWDECEANPKGKLPPRRDLELDAIVEILEGKRLDPLPQLSAGRNPRAAAHAARASTCRSARSSTCSRATRSPTRWPSTASAAQHVLRLVGVQVRGVRRDSVQRRDHARRRRRRLASTPTTPSWRGGLNLEAAKAVKYGGVPRGRGAEVRHAQPGQAAAHRQVRRLDRSRARTPTWSSGAARRCRTLGRCEQTWIDGRKYFDRDDGCEGERSSG